MKKLRNGFMWMMCLVVCQFLNGQTCECSIEEVIENRVAPCDKIIGPEVIVSSTEELRNAIRQANQTFGNRTILIEDGIYAIASTASYPFLTASNMVIRSRSGNRDACILTGQGMRSVSPLTENGLSLQGDNITIADLTIRDVGNHGIAMTGDEIVIHNVKIQDTYEQMIKGNQANGGAQNGVIQCCLLEYTNGIGPNWYIGGIDIHGGQNWHVHDNIFKHIKSPVQSVAEHAIHFWTNSANNLVERNIIIDCDRGIGFGLGSSSNFGGVIRNNMIFNDGNGRFDDVGIGLETSPNTKVYHNTIHIAYQNAIEYRFLETQQVEIKNNLVNQMIRSRNGAMGDVSNNIDNGILAWYEDPADGNLRLNQFVASVVDQGVQLNVELDIDQTTRPKGRAVDIGAHEYAVTTSQYDQNQASKLFEVYPNPASNQLLVQRTGFLQGGSLIVRGIEGEEVYRLLIGTESVVTIPVSDWPAGCYVVTLIKASGSSQKKLLIVD